MKKIGLLILAVVMALGVLGVGYAIWVEVLPISGTASTASWDITIRNADSPTIVGNAVVDQTVALDGKSLTIEVSNLSPGDDVTIPVFYAGPNTIPITTDLTIDRGTVPDVVLLSGDRNVDWPAGSVDDQANLRIRVPSSLTLDDIPQDASYTFSFDLTVSQ